MRVEKSNVLRGNFSIDGDLAVDGTLTGEIEVRGAFTVERSGEAGGSVRCRTATLAGAFNGTLLCEGPALVAPSAQVKGKIVAREVLFGPVADQVQAPAPGPKQAPAAPGPAPQAPPRVPLVTGAPGKLLVRPTAVLADKTGR